MADDLSVLLRIRGDAGGAKTAVQEARQAVSQLKTSTTTDLKAIQTASVSSLSTFTQTAGQLSTQLPVIGQAVSGLSSSFNALKTASAGSASSVAGVAGAAVVAAAALGSLASGAAQAVQSIVDLTVATAEFQGKLFDLSQQTGVSVETLSALEIVARQTGGSIESISASLGIFQKNLEEASSTADSKAAKAFERLGVQVTDTEQTFRDTLTALAKMPEGFRQTSLALELFGRGGKQVLAILKETQGDLDGTIEKLRGLGLVTTQEARRADEFLDQLVALQVVLRGMGSEAIPVVTNALIELQRTINENREAFDLVKGAIKFVAGSLSLQLETAVKSADAVWKSHRVEVNLLTEAYQILRFAIKGAVEEIPQQPILPQGAEDGLKLLREIARFGVPLTEKQDFSKIPGFIKDKSKSGGVNEGIQLLQQLQRELRGLEDATRAEEVAAELLETRFKGINPKIQEQILLVARTIDVKRQQLEEDKENEALAKEQEESRKRAAENLSAFLRQQVEELRNLQGVTKSAFDEVDDFIVAQQLLGEKTDASTEFLLRFNASMVEAAKAAEKAKNAFDNLVLPDIVGGGKGGGPLDILPGEEAPESPIQNLNEALTELGITMERTFGVGAEAGQRFADIVGGAIGEMARGVGALIENWVLVGETGPQAMRKLTASVLAGVAAQAAVKAIFELAEGFAALFFNPAAAAAHFKAAALFGVVAGVAAVAGRSIAGDAFRSPGGGSAGTGTGASGGQLNPLTLNRNQPQRIVIEVRAAGDKISQAFTAVVLDDLDTAGPIRQAFADDGRFT